MEGGWGPSNTGGGFSLANRPESDAHVTLLETISYSRRYRTVSAHAGVAALVTAAEEEEEEKGGRRAKIKDKQARLPALAPKVEDEDLPCILRPIKAQAHRREECNKYEADM